ncbi:MAG TPA: 4-(cytidine 5'-diphospho)-2-C-methyl-D-erythritol kinase [Gammaproteobacteria bacterium]|nr:4-(cytidine 5'-diphospho)-2-C-methyl-D-erythritol kinase [Gammaproteobacteria bacterium]
MRDSWPAPAKLNLFLHITGRRADGYHLLQTVFQFIDQCDRLSFEIRGDGVIRRVTDLAGVRSEDDLTVRAATLLRERAGCSLGADIHIEKNLPMGGGLGGGSSDAATTLHALNTLWGLDLPHNELLALALQLGADVPVFVAGHAAWAEGVGEVLTPIELAEPWYVVIVPPCQVNTAEIFQAPELTRDCQEITIGSFLSGQGGNVFEALVRSRHPQVDEALNWLERYASARMSGTGACVFAAFDCAAEARKVFGRRPRGWRGFVARGLNRSPLLDGAPGTA